MDWITSDARRIVVARALRSFSDGYVAISLGVYLAALGLDTVLVGLILTLTLVGAGALTVGTAFFADRLGRRRFMRLLAVLMAACCAVYASTDALWLLIVAAACGGLIATSLGGGAFLSLDLAVLPQTAPQTRRTQLLVLYNLVGALSGSLGSLFAGFAAHLAPAGQEIIAYRGLFVVSTLIAVGNLVLVYGLTPAVERVGTPASTSFLGVHRSRSTLARLAGLSSLDSFAAGFAIQSIVALWFAERWQIGLETLGPIFFSVNLLNAVSYLIAGRIARRIGLLRTIVATHLPASLMMGLVPFMPTVELAILVYVGRQFLGEMDAPARQSYYMAIVDADERVPVASFTNLARSFGGAMSPLLSGYAMGALTLGVPFLLFTGLKVVYLGATYAMFHQVHAPEEVAPPTAVGVARADS